MPNSLSKGHLEGTHRLIPPEATLENIRPHLAANHVTRCADLTGLDRIGIPVYCAIRPKGKTMQVANGKGLRHVDAKVSALMEAVEVFHAENPACELRAASYRELLGEGRRVVSPVGLPEHLGETFFSEEFRLRWVEGEDLMTGEEVWLPSSAAYISRPRLHAFTTNGLASGNHLVEATLHAIYEVVERDTVVRLKDGERLSFRPGRCQFIDTKTLPEGPLRELHELIGRAGMKLVLIRVAGVTPIHTFMAVILDSSPFSHATTVNTGYGSHLNGVVAAVRAVTEAAQVRLTYIHGSRQDVKSATYARAHTRPYDFFDRLPPNASWQELDHRVTLDLQADFDETLGHLRAAGVEHLYRVRMTREPFQIPVVKVIIPGMSIMRQLF